MLITTSRNPTHYLRRVSKIISLSFPNSQRLNRGSLNLSKIFAYCWNNQISRLLILQGTKKEDLIIVKAYVIGKKPQSIDATIKLTNIVSLRKHDKKRRIMVEKVHLEFSEEVNEVIQEKILDFFRCVIQDSKRFRTRKLLTISFSQKKPNFLIGIAVQQDSSVSLPLYNIHISTECGNNE